LQADLDVAAADPRALLVPLVIVRTDEARRHPLDEGDTQALDLRRTGQDRGSARVVPDGCIEALRDRREVRRQARVQIAQQRDVAFAQLDVADDLGEEITHLSVPDRATTAISERGAAL
jgi:hypothetical protein